MGGLLIPVIESASIISLRSWTEIIWGHQKHVRQSGSLGGEAAIKFCHIPNYKKCKYYFLKHFYREIAYLLIVQSMYNLNGVRMGNSWDKLRLSVLGDVNWPCSPQGVP